jgi:hypothetical protein
MGDKPDNLIRRQPADSIRASDLNSLNVGRIYDCNLQPANQSRHGKFVLPVSSVGGPLRVLRHAQVVEDQAHIAIELAHFLGDALNRLGLDEADGEAA